jgi:hypothetical protein
MSQNPCSNGEVAQTNPLCPLCEMTVKIIDYEVKTANATITSIEKAVEDLCCLIGGKVVYEECLPIIDSINKIVQWILSGLTPDQICQKLHLC